MAETWFNGIMEHVSSGETVYVELRAINIEYAKLTLRRMFQNAAVRIKSLEPMEK